MKPYWDSSALVETISNRELEARLVAQGGYSRSHTLTEVFSALTGKMHIRLEANEAAKAVRAMAERIQFVSLSEQEILDALDQAQARGVRGGRVHDYIHVIAAIKSGAHALLTMDKNDFENLASGLTVEQV